VAPQREGPQKRSHPPPQGMHTTLEVWKYWAVLLWECWALEQDAAVRPFPGGCHVNLANSRSSSMLE